MGYRFVPHIGEEQAYDCLRTTEEDITKAEIQIALVRTIRSMSPESLVKYLDEKRIELRNLRSQRNIFLTILESKVRTN